MTWPSHYPADCPPEGANDAVGEIYRLVTKRELQNLSSGFLCFKLKVPDQCEGKDPCLTSGLSVSVTYQDCIYQKEVSPFLRKKVILFTVLEDPLGKILSTEHVSKGHYTWWIPSCMEEPWELFEVCDHVAT